MAAFNTPTGVLSFPHTHTPQSRDGADGPPAYSVSVIFDKEKQASPKYKRLMEECQRLAKELADEKKIKVSQVRLPFIDCEDKEGMYKGYNAGDMRVAPWSKFAPQCFDPDGDLITDANSIWAGQLVRANVTPFKWARSGKYGVSLGLNGVKFEKMDVERMDGRSLGAAMFEDDDEVF